MKSMKSGSYENTVQIGDPARHLDNETLFGELIVFIIP